MKIFSLPFVILFMMAIGGTAVEATEQEVEMLEWEEVNELLPRYSKFTVMDVETGKKFRVQRRAGSRHADVQPLTSKDTKIMKEIYHGKWSWKRRSIIVLTDDLRIAASMHGMPHGAGALKNNFPGHFCIHFYGSTTHRSNFMDLSHKLMILKSAGKLEEYIQTANPYELGITFLTGLKQQDEKVVSETSLQSLEWQKVFRKLENLTVERMDVLPIEDIKDELYLTVPVSLTMQIRNAGLIRYNGVLRLVRFSPYGSWKVDGSSFMESIDEEG